MLKHETCPIPSLSLSVSQQKHLKLSLSCLCSTFHRLPVLYCSWCAGTLRRRLGLHELRYVAVLLSAVNNDSRNAVLAATAVPQQNTATPHTCFGSYRFTPCLYCRYALERRFRQVWIANAAIICRCVSLCTQQCHLPRSASCTLLKT